MTTLNQQSPILKPIRVDIDGHVVEYHLRQTSAPKDYDYFGAFTLYAYDSGNKSTSFRIVAIPDEFFQSQVARYASGLHTPILVEQWQRNELIEALWKRLTAN